MKSTLDKSGYKGVLAHFTEEMIYRHLGSGIGIPVGIVQLRSLQLHIYLQKWDLYPLLTPAYPFSK